MTAVARLESHLQALGRTLLGYSGGVDSAVLAVCGTRALGADRFLAVIGRSASYPAVQHEQAVALARMFHVPVLEVQTSELEDSAYRANQGDRCFHCKQELWGRLRDVARDQGFATIIDGTNLDDLGEHRPGLAAGAAAGIRSPLAELGFAKAQVREMAQALDLPVWDAPAAPCLASRISQGLPVTEARLRQVERAEEALRALGIGGNLRVRHRGSEATVEADSAWIGWIESHWADIEPLLVRAGFARASLDARGYRRGGLAAELPVVQG